MTPDIAIDALRAIGDAAKADDVARYHKVERPYLGVANPDVYALADAWRGALDVPQRVELADGLWQSNIHEARVAAARLLSQARLRPDDAPAWELIKGWVATCDAWAIADHACGAGAKRLVWDHARLDDVETWTTSEHMWTRRAALIITLPWTKGNANKPRDLIIRDRVLGWAAGYVADPEWYIQKSIAWWLRELSKHDADRVMIFIEEHGEKMKPFARKEAARLISSSDA
jgi:3-methyladenine DNA glycosylase AlkD